MFHRILPACVVLASVLTQALRTDGEVTLSFQVATFLGIWILAFVKFIATLLHGAALMAVGWLVGTMFGLLGETYIDDAVARVGTRGILRPHTCDARCRCAHCLFALLPCCDRPTQLKVMALWALGGLASFSSIVAGGKLIFGDWYYWFVVVATFPGSGRLCAHIIDTLRTDGYAYARDLVALAVRQVAPLVGLQVEAEATSTTNTTAAAAPPQQQPAPTSAAVQGQQGQAGGSDRLGAAIVVLSNNGQGDLDDADDYRVRVIEPVAAFRRQSSGGDVSVCYDALEFQDFGDDEFVMISEL